MLKLCELFDINIDELLNQDISKVKENRQSKNNINKFIDDFLSYFTKAIDMFTNMGFKEIVKCLLEIVVSGLLIILILLIIGGIGGVIVGNVLQILPYNIYMVIYSILEGIYGIVALIFGIILLLHIFKVRYLDYYEIVKEKTSEENKIVFEKKQEKIIIRDPKHTSNNFVSALLKFFLICIKIFVIFIALNFCFSLIFFVICLVLSFMIIKTGLLFIGILLGLIGSIIINILILIVLYNFIISKNNNFKLIGLSFLVSLLLIGIGVGLSIIAIKDFDVANYDDPKYFVKEELTFNGDDVAFIHNYSNIHMIENDNNNIKAEIFHSKYYAVDFNTDTNKGLYYSFYPTYDNFMLILREELEAFNEKKIFNISDCKINIYTSKENIDRIQENLN